MIVDCSAPHQRVRVSGDTDAKIALWGLAMGGCAVPLYYVPAVRWTVHAMSCDPLRLAYPFLVLMLKSSGTIHSPNHVRRCPDQIVLLQSLTRNWHNYCRHRHGFRSGSILVRGRFVLDNHIVKSPFEQTCWYDIYLMWKHTALGRASERIYLGSPLCLRHRSLDSVRGVKAAVAFVQSVRKPTFRIETTVPGSPVNRCR